MTMKYQEVHAERLELLREILRITDIELNALKVNDVDILEGVLAEKGVLISKHDALVASVPEYAHSSEYHQTEVMEMLKKIQDYEEETFKAYGVMKEYYQREAQENRKKKNTLNKQMTVEKAYAQRGAGTGSKMFDRKE